jgi:predicted XRE-type DNA-binding protein
VFTDLKVADPDVTLVKAELAHAISTLIRARDLTLLEAAALMGIDQPKVSALMRGRLDGSLLTASSGCCLHSTAMSRLSSPRSERRVRV